MRIVTRKEFLQLPPYTLYCKYESCCVGEPLIKYVTCGENDWRMQDLTSISYHDSSELVVRRTAMEVEGFSYPLELGCTSRDGLFDNDQLFMIYEDDDIKKLIAELQQCLSDKQKPIIKNTCLESKDYTVSVMTAANEDVAYSFNVPNLGSVEFTDEEYLTYLAWQKAQALEWKKQQGVK